MYIPGYHNRLGHCVDRQKPSFWSFVTVVKDEEQHSFRSARLARHGHPGPQRKRKYRILEKKIRRLKRSYANGRRGLFEYWAAVTHVIGDFV